MTSRRVVVATLAVVVAAGLLVSPMGIRGGMRYYALQRVLKPPEARPRASVRPSRRTLTAPPRVQPIDLGYATLDTGSTNPISIVALSRGAVLLLSNSDVSMVFLPPYGPAKTTNLARMKVSAAEARRYPQVPASLQEAETNQLIAEMKMEETRLLPFSDVLSMSNDEFLGYSMRLLFKSADQFGSREVQFFENRYAKGIARIGKATNDSRFAAVVFASPDGTRQVGLQLKIPDESTNDLSTVLDPILGSFRFTADRVDDQEKVKTLIREAGIRQREDSQRDTGERIGAETNRRPSAAGFRH